jgi:hypothetical protein
MMISRGKVKNSEKSLLQGHFAHYESTELKQAV